MNLNNFNNINNFNNLGLSKKLLKIIYNIGYKIPTEIQIKCIPLFIEGKDILAIAKTGSGKTASFVLPILNNIKFNNDLQVLILSPTRELVIQIFNFFKLFIKYFKDIKVVSLYGGQNYNIQFSNLKKNPNIVIATPGRLLDHINRKTIYLNNINVLVIDEADEMLHMGFINDVKNIIKNIKIIHQTALFSATMSLNIINVTKNIMNNPKEIILNKNNVNLNIIQYFCFINPKFKINILINFLETEVFNRLIIFVKTKEFSSKLSLLLEKKGYLSSALNGDISQYLREKIILNFRNGLINILVATDIASRGLDINNVNLIINYDLPYNINSYIHRIGRTGRADNIGKAILFLENKDLRFLKLINRKFNYSIKRIRLPDFNTLLNSRLNKILKLINDNFNKNNLLLNFYRKFLNKIINYFNNKKEIEDITLSLLILVYENNFSKFSYKDLLNIKHFK